MYSTKGIPSQGSKESNPNGAEKRDLMGDEAAINEQPAPAIWGQERQRALLLLRRR